MGPVSPGLEKWGEQGGKSDGDKPGLEGMRSHQSHSLERNTNSNQHSDGEFIANDTTGAHSSFWKLKMIPALGLPFGQCAVELNIDIHIIKGFSCSCRCVVR